VAGFSCLPPGLDRAGRFPKLAAIAARALNTERRFLSQSWAGVSGSQMAAVLQQEHKVFANALSTRFVDLLIGFC
jgi:hypothetical protein